MHLYYWGVTRNLCDVEMHFFVLARLTKCRDSTMKDFLSSHTSLLKKQRHKYKMIL